MDFGMVVIVGGILLVLWVLGGVFSVMASKKARQEKSIEVPRPEFRLADQWLQSSQTKLEAFIEKIESPLGTAQHELLDLRLEAGRLPQGVKNLREVRENLALGIKPLARSMTLQERAALYLSPEHFQSVTDKMLVFKTPLGDLPCREALVEGELLNDETIKAVYRKLLEGPIPENGTGCLAYFPKESQLKEFQAHGDWVSAFKEHRLIPLDLKGLTALLIALRLHHDVENTLRIFEAGVESTQALVGQADKMAEALGKISADSLKSRVVMEGGVPTPVVLDSMAAKPESRA